MSHWQDSSVTSPEAFVSEQERSASWNPVAFGPEGLNSGWLLHAECIHLSAREGNDSCLSDMTLTLRTD
jgi:hypothetical protein